MKKENKRPGAKPLPPGEKKQVRAVLLKPADWTWLQAYGENPSQQIEKILNIIRRKER